MKDGKGGKVATISGASPNLVSGSTMFATTSAGNLWVYPAPLASSDFEEYFLHATKNKNLRLQGPTCCCVIPREQ